VFPLIPAIAGIAKGVGSLLKNNKDVKNAYASYQNTGVATSMQPSKGFLGLFTGKKKVEKYNEFVAAAEKEKAANTGSTVMQWWPVVVIIAGITFIIWVFGRKRGGRK
jgi:predicted nucleotide-binding protein (sugar kinase/HSP70/actin superfamily)